MGVREYCIKFFLVLVLAILTSVIILEDIQTEGAGIIIWLLAAVVGDVVLEKPIASIWKNRR